MLVVGCCVGCVCCVCACVYVYVCGGDWVASCILYCVCVCVLYCVVLCVCVVCCVECWSDGLLHVGFHLCSLSFLFTPDGSVRLDVLCRR